MLRESAKSVLSTVFYLTSTLGLPEFGGTMRHLEGERREIEIDVRHGGIVKVNPLVDWTDDAVWAYVKDGGLPYNRLYDMGYTSIGCAPCTRAIGPGENARDGALVVGARRRQGVRHSHEPGLRVDRGRWVAPSPCERGALD